MKKWLLYLIIAIIIFGGLFLILLGGEKKNMQKPEESKKADLPPREPAVAGAFYPGAKNELEAEIEQYLSQAKVPKVEGQILGLMVPHAGYIYSGPAAAHGFKLLEGQEVETVVLIGNSHQEFFEGVAVWTGGAFKTPLGETPIDYDLAEKLIKENEKIKDYQNPHLEEHSLEVEVPFLQKTLQPTADPPQAEKPGFKILPILFGNSGQNDWQILADALAKNIIGRNVLIVASTDMSHYPSYDQANYADQKTLEAILTGQVSKLAETIKALEKEGIPGASTFLCGHDAVKTLMELSQKIGVKEIKLLKYTNSGDTAGDKSQVVGYGAVAFLTERRGSELTKQEQEKLLEIAKQSVESHIKRQKVPAFEVSEPILNQKLGAFVTIKKQGQLRGCIGRFQPDIPLWQVVSKMAIAAATEDIRFYPVTEDELSELEYEVSVLSPLKKIDDWRQIDYGQHGVQIKKGLRGGVFLPQVAQETGWSFEEFMASLCSQKAGLPSDCWREPGTELYTFTAQVFHE